jgi:hypothetical protein
MKKFILTAFTGIIILASCTRTVPCGNLFVTPAFVGFKLSDLDTLVIREYKKDDGFITPLDTALIVSDSDILSKGSSNDTTVILLNYISGREKYIFPDHDWQIYIPAQNMVVSMSDFDSPQKDKKCFLGGDLCPACSNPINSFLQDGQRVIPQLGKIPYTGGDYYLAYIHR